VLSDFRFRERLDRTGNETMVTGTTLRTPYDNRLQLVQDTLTTYSALDANTASELAVHVLHVLNSIPEKVR
jgi:hypothetical protein